MAFARTGQTGEKRIYRRKWAESSNPLVIEARSQTLALQRLQTWLRLAYALLAAAVLLAYWGFVEADQIVFGVCGCVMAVVVFAAVVVLRIGIRNGRENVSRMLDVLESQKAETAGQSTTS